MCGYILLASNCRTPTVSKSSVTCTYLSTWWSGYWRDPIASEVPSAASALDCTGGVVCLNAYIQKAFDSVLIANFVKMCVIAAVFEGLPCPKIDKDQIRHNQCTILSGAPINRGPALHSVCLCRNSKVLFLCHSSSFPCFGSFPAKKERALLHHKYSRYRPLSQALFCRSF